MSEIKLCKDCKHFNKGPARDLHYCMKRPNPVDGGGMVFCDLERKGVGHCGPGGDHWEKASKRKPWWRLW